MKRIVINLAFGLLFLTGFGVLSYPTISDQWNTYRQSRLISTYEETIAQMEPEDYSREWEAAENFNAALEKNNLYGDAFGTSDQDLADTEYWKILNAAGDGVMGYLSIPKINIRLAIYHGTDETILDRKSVV